MQNNRQPRSVNEPDSSKSHAEPLALKVWNDRRTQLAVFAFLVCWYFRIDKSMVFSGGALTGAIHFQICGCDGCDSAFTVVQIEQEIRARTRKDLKRIAAHG